MEDAYGLHFMGGTLLTAEGIYRMIAVNAEVMAGAGWMTSGNVGCVNRVG
ncbi:hypothetical protein [Brevibacterium sp. ZH18]|nr:hypothetical protein [Brevibacterium sp. ZH18]MCI4012142.1 hypothetical protein [Brevibacterium sp. ZH18]